MELFSIRIQRTFQLVSTVSMFILLFLIAILSLIYRWKLLLRGLGLHME